MNDKERGQWVDNDEGLYVMMLKARQSKRQFVRENRELIDRVAGVVVRGESLRTTWRTQKGE